jgi:crotonobetainyl-CoA:carnitine CoA-transferase CaiB-like acyl-CoA transferase
MNDYIAGYLGTAGIQAALIRRAKEGASYHVRVNLARCAMWFMSLGAFDKNAAAHSGEQHQLLAPETITTQTPYSELVRRAPPMKFSETKSYREDPVLVVFTTPHQQQAGPSSSRENNRRPRVGT